VTCRIQPANGRTYRFCPIDAPVEAGRFRVVAQARIIEDSTLGVPPVPLHAATTMPGFGALAGRDGLVGVTGRPAALLPPSQAPGTPVDLTIDAPGYATLALGGALGAQPGYPGAFTPVDLGVWRLQRPSVAIHGRVVRRVGRTDQPVTGATVTVTAAVPVPPSASAQPAPPTAGSFIGMGDVTGTAGTYRIGPLARAVRLTLTATQGGGTIAVAVSPDYALAVNLVDIRLP
jgi:hypothetical protein